MPLHIIEKDITTMNVDAIVNSTNHNMIGYSGVDEILHAIGGEEFEAECVALRNKCLPGEAIHSNAYNLPCRYIIHTIGPRWYDGTNGEAAILRSCYRSSLEVAEQLGCKSVAFPLIAAGTMGYPISEALKNAVTPISEYLSLYSDMDVYLVLFGAAVTQIAKSIFGDMDDVISKNYVFATTDTAMDLDTLLKNPGESFVDMLYRFMDERGIVNPAQLYKKAGVTKAAYSKLISGVSKKPSMETAVGLAMALELSYDDAVHFLASAGIALSNSSKFDMIVSYFIQNGNYDIWELDVQLVKYGYKSLLGAE